MLNQYFGQYLLNKGILTPTQYYDVLRHEKSTRVKLGILAINAGFMTAAQVGKVHNLQRVQDKKFGELAVEQGYLSDAQVGQLLDSQSQGHLAMIQTIADKSYLTLNAIETALADFRAEYGRLDAALVSYNPIDEDAVIRSCIDLSQAGGRADYLYQYVNLLLRNILRFLNEAAVILPTSADGDKSAEWVASQTITGETAFSVNLCMNETVLLAIASRFNNEPLSLANELAIDSIGEFLNVHNGVFCGNLSENGIRSDLQAQVVRRDSTNTVRDLEVPIGTSFGRFDLVFSLT